MLTMLAWRTKLESIVHMLNARHSLEGQGQEESWSVLASWSKQVINLQAYLEVQSQKIRLGMTEEDIQ